MRINNTFLFFSIALLVSCDPGELEVQSTAEIRDTFNYHWTAASLVVSRFDYSASPPTVIRWQHRDSIQVKFFTKITEYRTGRYTYRGVVSVKDSLLRYAVMDSSIPIPSPVTSTIATSPTSFHASTEAKVYAPEGLEVR